MATTPIDAHSTSDAGTRVPVKPGPRDEKYVTELDPEADLVMNETQRAVDEAKKQLPARQGPGEINWLGSSYSGQDIKVVAHLYQASKDIILPKETQLTNDMEYYDALKSGADTLGQQLNQLALNTNTFDERSAAFDAATGLAGATPGEQRALKDLRSQILHGGDFSSFIGIAKMHQALEGISKSAEDNTAAARDELKRIQEGKLHGTSTISLGALQTMSIQSHREKFGVRAIGHSYVKGYTRGPRTLAGSMIFTVFDEHPLLQLIRAMGDREAIWRDPEISSLIPDQLPPIDLTVVFANEYGSISRLNIYGAEFINDGVTFSIDNLLSEQVVNFVARDVDVMTKVGEMRLSRLQRNMDTDRDTTASSLLGGDEYTKYLDILRVRRRLGNR